MAGTAGVQPLRMGALEWALLGLHSMLWGSAFFLAELAIPELPLTTIAAFRLIPAALLVVGICFALGYRLPAAWDAWVGFLALAVVNNITPMLLILWAQHQVTGGMAAVFNATTPLFGLFLGHFLTHDEKISSHKLAGILTGIAGVGVLVGLDVAAGAASGVLAKLALLGAALCYAAAGFYARNFAATPPFVLAAGQMIGACLLAIPLALLVDRPWALPRPSSTAVGAVVAMGLFGSALASLCYFTLIKRAGATNAMLVTLLLPVTPMILGSLFLGDSFTLREVAGAAIVALALVIIDGRLLRRGQ